MKISIVSPVFSEDKELYVLVEKLFKEIGDYLYQLIFVYHPDSDENCKIILEDINKKYKKVEIIPQDLSEKGNGSAFRQGFLAVKGDYVLMIDSDGEMDAATIPIMINKIQESDCDVVIGSRYAKGGGIKGNYPFSKYVLNRSFQAIFKILFRTKINDLTFGFKLFKVKIIEEIKFNSTHQNIGAETTLRPIKMGYRVCEVPTILNFRQTGEAHSLSLRGNLKYPILAIKILFNR